MRTPLILALSAVTWLTAGHAASADEVSGNKTEGTQTSVSNGAADTTDDSIFEPGPSPQRLRGGGNVEWRRNDHPNTRQDRGGRNSGGNGSGGGSGSGGGGGSSD